MLPSSDVQKKSHSQVLSDEETKQYLTPFAFKMDETLFGLPLASPAKRGIALLIDFSLIAVLSGTSGDILTLSVAFTLYYLGNKKRALEQGKKKGHKRRAIMRFIAGLMLLVIMLSTLPDLLDYADTDKNIAEDNVSNETMSFTNTLALTATALAAIETIADSQCLIFSCWQSELDSVAVKMATISFEANINITQAKLDDIFSSLVDETALAVDEKEQLTASMRRSYEQEFSQLSGIKAVSSSAQLTKDGKANDNVHKAPIDKQVWVLDKNDLVTDTRKVLEEKPNKPVYSIIELVKGIIDDLGLGFGWATFYFTVFISVGRGQTIGKKLLGIKVLQLDGTPLSLWDSFGRYGGYGAGLATGLLGFLQIYWDPNKQAIHDQISATVVIDIRKSRIQGNENFIGKNS